MCLGFRQNNRRGSRNVRMQYCVYCTSQLHTVYDMILLLLYDTC